MKLKNRKRFFIHAPAFYGNKDANTGEFVSRRLRTIQNPFDDETKPWRRNIYYFWWEFLKRHEGYRKCCERGGTGEYSALYTDWGNIHAYTAETFWDWWNEKLDNGESRGEYLFAEPPLPRRITIADKVAKDTQTLTVNLPLEIRTPELLKFMRL